MALSVAASRPSNLILWRWSPPHGGLVAGISNLALHSMRKLHLKDSKRTGSRQIVLERDFPKMGIGNVEVSTADRKTVRPGKFRGVADEDFCAQLVIRRQG